MRAGIGNGALSIGTRMAKVGEAPHHYEWEGHFQQDQPMIKNSIVALAAAAIALTACAVSPADARTKRERQDDRPYVGQGPPSLDGRVTGRARTCGYDTFQYDNLGVPMGPYCH
jgi:hypothetical protein